MFDALYRSTALHWHVLRAKIRAFREGDEGVTTLEIIVIAVGLVALATLAIVALTAAVGKETNSLPS